jgi:trans-aconitate methyltransferase
MAAPYQAPGQLREWDAASYDALPLPHERWGQRLLATLPLRGDEIVLDVGAGTGRDTEALLRRLPGGHVIAVDGSAVYRVAARLPEPAVDYVRLQAAARRPA